MKNQFQILALERGNILVGPEETEKPVGTTEIPLIPEYAVCVFNLREDIARKDRGLGMDDLSGSAYIERTLGKMNRHLHLRVEGPQEAQIF
jgi:hypothetical protein